MMKFCITFSILLSLLFSLQTNATDLEDKPQKKQIDRNLKEKYYKTQEEDIWNGFYATTLLGTGHYTHKIITNDTTSHSRSGYHTLGMTAGYNYVKQSITLGLEGEIATSFNEIGHEQFTLKEELISTARVRLGSLPHKSLYTYLLAGISVSRNQEYTEASPSFYNNKIGWQVGIGSEISLSNTSFARIEYFHNQHIGNNETKVLSNAVTQSHTNNFRIGLGRRF